MSEVVTVRAVVGFYEWALIKGERIFTFHHNLIITCLRNTFIDYKIFFIKETLSLTAKNKKSILWELERLLLPLGLVSLHLQLSFMQ